MSVRSLFVIVGSDDVPLYQCEFSSKQDNTAHLSQFILHAALDIVDELEWYSTSCYLKTVDKFNDLQVSAFVTPRHVRFMLLHDNKSEDTVKTFFQEVYEVYLKVSLNPFYQPGDKITDPLFDARVQGLGKRLG